MTGNVRYVVQGISKKIRAWWVFRRFHRINAFVVNVIFCDADCPHTGADSSDDRLIDQGNTVIDPENSQIPLQISSNILLLFLQGFLLQITKKNSWNLPSIGNPLEIPLGILTGIYSKNFWLNPPVSLTGISQVNPAKNSSAIIEGLSRASTVEIPAENTSNIPARFLNESLKVFQNKFQEKLLKESLRKLLGQS